MYTMEYYLAIKKNEVMPLAATRVDLETTILSEVSQIKTYIICYHLYVEFKKQHVNELIYKTETERDLENKLTVIKEERWQEEINKLWPLV